MEDITYETIVRKLITRHSPKQSICKKCGKSVEMILATNCDSCGKELEINYEKLKFAVDLLKGFIYKYSNMSNDYVIDSKAQSHLSDIIYSTDNNFLGNISLDKEKNVLHFISVFFDFMLENKVMLGNPIYNICVTPDLKTIYFNPVDDPNFYGHFGNVEFGMPYFYGSFAYIREFYDQHKPSFWKRIKKIF